jgi:hypothetical protein
MCLLQSSGTTAGTSSFRFLTERIDAAQGKRRSFVV